MTTDITELAQSLKAAANTTADAIDRLKAFPGDELIDLSQHEGEQVDIDITTINEWYELSSPANVLELVEALEKAQHTITEMENRIRKQNRHICELFDDNRALRQRIAVLEESNAQVIQSHDHYKRMTEEGLKQLAEFRTVTIEPFRSFVTDADLAALHRFAECCDDPESGGHDLEKEQVRRLEEIGALQRSGRISYITGFGDVLISITAGIKAEGE
ncbi:TPA: hypothetical protein ACTW9E_001488 [Klebsiella michiganensis]